MLEWLSLDGKLIFLAKTARTFGYGFIAIIFPVYLSDLGLAASLIGVAVTATLIFTAILTVTVSLFADATGRKKTLLLLTGMHVTSAAIFLFFPHPIVAVLAAIIGNISVTAGETGSFLSIEQAILPDCCENRKRNYTFSLYNIAGYGAFSLGSLLAGLPALLQSYLGRIDAYKPLFGIYLATGAISALCYGSLSRRSEVKEKGPSVKFKISEPSRPLVTKLSLLFAMDALGGGFIVQSILAYWFYAKFQANLSELGIIFFLTQITTAISFLMAAKIASRIGLLNTMVFTHLPSNILLIAVAFAPTLYSAVTLLLARHSLSQMDVPTRQSYIVAVIDPGDRTAAAGITNVSRTIAQSISPSLSGHFIQYAAFGLPFVMGGGLKIVYDILLYLNFRRLRPPEEATAQAHKRPFAST